MVISCTIILTQEPDSVQPSFAEANQKNRGNLLAAAPTEVPTDWRANQPRYSEENLKRNQVVPTGFPLGVTGGMLKFGLENWRGDGNTFCWNWEGFVKLKVIEIEDMAWNKEGHDFDRKGWDSL